MRTLAYLIARRCAV